ncbi:putative mitochondrial protein [Cucumis melo var. makuwa]|uniref:Putative mitochondrial protein n=1 Tax=Cucumis melo var. makuwa TaxID=1194695 RepID=A0A5D3BEJ5_CUCMM|nr:putative mitochondrial protein [Cucumis melo var. makuwa]
MSPLKIFLRFETESTNVVCCSDIVITGNDASGKFGAKPSGTPMMPNQELVKEEQLCKDPERYRRLVGKLNFLTVTRPDITYSISVASQFMSSPTLDHWATVEKILCYLKATLGNDRRSTSGYYVFVGKNLVSWKIALHIASNPVFHERTKHIEVDCHFIHEKIQDGLVSIGYVKTEEQLGDVLTKVVNAARISYLCNKLDMIAGNLSVLLPHSILSIMYVKDEFGDKIILLPLQEGWGMPTQLCIGIISKYVDRSYIDVETDINKDVVRNASTLPLPT